MAKKILIGCPTYERYRYCLGKYLQAVRKINYPDYDIMIVDNSPTDSFFNEFRNRPDIIAQRVDYSETARKRIIDSRNLILKKAIEGGYDYFFSLEQDLIVNPEIINILLSHNVPIVSAYYGKDLLLTLRDDESGEIKKAMINLPVIYMQEKEGVRQANANEVFGKGLIEVGAFGLGCIMISREVFEKIQFRYDPEKKAFDDMYFCIDAKKLGYKLYCDGNTVVEHLHKEWEKDIEK
jgi:GT2 family glycosyltransferase